MRKLLGITTIILFAGCSSPLKQEYHHIAVEAPPEPVVELAVPPITAPPPTTPTTIKKSIPVQRTPVAPRASRSQGPGCQTGSANAYAPNANCSGCESRNVQQFNPSGKYWGKYQFDRGTWAAHGGDPAAYGSADEKEQDRVAANVKYDAWPNC